MSNISPDAELLALGAELEPIIQEWHAQRAIDAAHDAEFERLAELAGLPQIDRGSDMPIEAWRKYQDKRLRLARFVKSGEDEDEDVWTRIHDRMHAL